MFSRSNSHPGNGPADAYTQVPTNITSAKSINAGTRTAARDANRGQWASKTEFMLSCIGYAVGIGNVWRFPYLCYRSGGGAFLVPYLLMLFLCGIPLFFMEIVMGQFSSVGCIGVFRLAPLFKGAGFAIVIVNIICTCYYSVIIAYPIMFLSKLFSLKLPWIDCQNAWNTDHCVEVMDLAQRNFTHHTGFRTPADEFFHFEILKISGSIEELGDLVWPLFYCLIFVWLSVYVCIIRGIKTVGKVVYFTASFPFFILFVLFIRGVTLPGAWKGILFYIKPEWSRLLDLKVWADAAIQIFFSLGPGWGGIVNMASFNNFRNNARGDAFVIPIVNCATSIFAGFVVFSVLGFLSHQSGIPVATVATSGPGLAFVTYPQAIAMLPMPHLWAALFFLMLFLLGLDSVFVQIEAIISSIIDEIPKLRQHKALVTLGSVIIMFLMSIIMVTRGGIFILQLFDWYSASISVILICISEVVMVAWIYGVDNFIADIYFMIGKRPGIVWKYCWTYVTPVILIGMFFTSIIFNRDITYNGIIYPRWAIALGWLSCAISIACIPAYMIYALVRSQGTLVKTVRRQLQAVDWTPANEEYRLEYEEYQRSRKLTSELHKSRVESMAKARV
ncbi:sodium- and chloride-dependent glycine transporter 1 isoform X1 [Bactrocera dorsalis]|uniref:Transporter n=3 Tax=Bactrocera dorsalis TaxID=27457 RepID=A0ABM3J0C1_BACDO|nr:sodium- and chloride-dependent glycine transporter 1 isoform X1 [Bactrocera dorsalis]XP_049302686.1 sodium- and chloride-dependent glycine transporter 1 isoform X1 [Bactrocera dorsalis]